jgi:uncharacterized protein
MTVEKPFIHLLKTPGGYYIYDVNTNRILKTGESVYRYLGDELKNHEDNPGEPPEAVGKMIHDGFLSAQRIQEVVHPVDQMLEQFLNSKLRMITLQITQQCNLRCKYCTYSGSYLSRTHANKRMSLELAKRGIDFLISRARDSRTISVGFYGGEPLLELETVQRCIEYTEAKAEGRKLIFNITTNGTLIKEEIIEFFEAHDVTLMISLDGPKEIHDQNRSFAVGGCGTFDKIVENLEKIRNRFPEYYQKIFFNMVIDPKNGFTCSNEFVMNYEMVKDSIFSSSTISNFYSKKEIDVSNEFIRERGYEVFKGFLAELNRIDPKSVSKLVAPYFSRMKQVMHDEREYSFCLPEKAHHSGPCIPGVSRLFMNIEGNFFPCERVSEISEVMKIGHIDRGFDIDRIRPLLNIGQLTEKNCRNCWAFRYCELCAASADVLTDLSGEQKITYCGMIRGMAEETLKDYCALKEMGHDFEAKNLAIYGI